MTKTRKGKAAHGSLYSLVMRFRLPVILAALVVLAVIFIIYENRSVPVKEGSLPFDVDIGVSSSASPIANASASVSLNPAETPVPIESGESYAIGDTDERIVEMQMRLMELGYLPADEPSEYFGEPLKNAVKLFQRANHMSQTGVADELTLQLLFSPTASNYIIEFGNYGNDVQMVQERLNQLGYYEDMNNGYYGVATERAVQDFQLMNSLTVNGRADTETYSLMFSPYAIGSYGVTPEPMLTPLLTPGMTPAIPTKNPTSAPVHTILPHATPTPQISRTPVPTSNPKPTAHSTPVSTPVPTPVVPTVIPTAMPSHAPEFTVSPETDVPTEQPVSSGNIEAFISALYAQLGKPYVFGDSGPDSFDCSGLVYYCLNQAGINIGRLNAAGYSMYDEWELIEDISNLCIGDLVFFYDNSYNRISHVGVYIGNNQFLHASSSSGKVVISNAGNWFHTYFARGRRVFH